MNSELKALINTAFDAEKIVADGIKKSYLSLISDALQVMYDVQGDLSGFSGLRAEILGLAIPANESDLIAFLQQKFSTIVPLSSAKAQAILSIVVSIIAKAIELEQSIVS